MSPAPTPATFPPRLEEARAKYRERSALAELERATRSMEALAAAGRDSLPAARATVPGMKPTNLLAVSVVLLLSACAAEQLRARAAAHPDPSSSGEVLHVPTWWEEERRRFNEAEPTPSCWQCRAPLGSTEDCMTCAAKRAEEAKR